MSNLVLAIFAWCMILALVLGLIFSAGKSRSRDE
jgi:hypothetical protein